MSKNVLLLSIVNSVLGEGINTSGNNYAYMCPSCGHHKPKLEIDFTENAKGTNFWHCWVCSFKGGTIYKLLQKVGASQDKVQKARTFVSFSDFHDYEEGIIEKVELPKDYIYLAAEGIEKDWIYNKAIKYLSGRNVTKGDILKYKIGYCRQGPYRGMIIFPTLNAKGELNFFISRSFEESSWMKYKNPKVSRDIIPNSHLINWSLPIILCEGIFDAMAVKRNAIPILGKVIQKRLLNKLLASDTKKIYIAMDKDAQSKALEYCEMFMNQDKEVYFVDLQDKDPSEMGFNKFTKLVQQTQPLSYSELVSIRLDY